MAEWQPVKLKKLWKRHFPNGHLRLAKNSKICQQMKKIIILIVMKATIWKGSAWLGKALKEVQNTNALCALDPRGCPRNPWYQICTGFFDCLYPRYASPLPSSVKLGFHCYLLHLTSGPLGFFLHYKMETNHFLNTFSGSALTCFYYVSTNAQAHRGWYSMILLFIFVWAGFWATHTQVHTERHAQTHTEMWCGR